MASPTASPPPSQSPSTKDLSPTEIAALVARGHSFIKVGDIASARLFYERAANAGYGPAALRLRTTFDPSFLTRAGLRSYPGTPDRPHSGIPYAISEIRTPRNG